MDELPSGKFRVRVRLPNGRRVSKSFDDRPSAESFRRGATAIFAEKDVDDVSETFGAFGGRWLDQRELAGEHRSMESQRSVWRHHVEGTALAARPLARVERRDVRDWLAAMKTKKATLTRRKGRDGSELIPTTRPLARSTIHTALVLVRQALAAAVDLELLAANAAHDVKLGRGRASTEKPWTFLDAEEIAAVRSAAEDAIPAAARLIYTVAIFTGLREGELWGARWSDVALEGDRPQIEVRRSYDGPTKTGRSRIVPLLTPAREALTAWKKLCPRSSKGLVFPNTEGEMRHVHDDAGWSDRRSGRGKDQTVSPGHKSRAGIARRVRFHDLRHTCASHLVMGTWGRAWRLEEVRDFLGHTTIATTQRYAHLSPDHLHKAAKETGSGGSGDGGAKPLTEPERKAGEGSGDVRVTDGSQIEQASETNDETTGFLIRRSGVRVPSRVPLISQGISLEALMGRDPGVTQRARDLLAAAASGEGIPAELVNDLIGAVITHPVVSLAVRAEAGGPSRLTLALRLAAELLATEEALRDVEGRA